MGTKVQLENHLPGHCSMRDLSRESNGAIWPSCFGDNNLPNGQFYYGFLPKTVADSHSVYDKDVVKQTMLEHEAIFKNQVYELHRLYRVQRDLMDEVRRKEQFERQIPYETSSSSSPVPSQIKYEDVLRWNGSSLPLTNSVSGRPNSGLETVQSSPQPAKGKSIQGGLSSLQNCYSPKNSEVSESRPTKLRRRMLDLQLPADVYIDTDEVDQLGDAKVSDSISPSLDNNGKFLPENGTMECGEDASRSELHVSKSKALADLNEPLHVDEMTAVSSADFLSNGVCHNDVNYRDLSMKTFSSSRDVTQNSTRGSLNGVSKNYHIENRSRRQDLFCYALESEKQKGSLRSINQGMYPDRGPTPLLDPTIQPPPFSTGDHFKGDTWKAKSGVNIEKSAGSYTAMNYSIPDHPTMAPRLPNQPSLFYPTDLGKSWDQCASSWGKPSSSFGQKSPSVQTSPFLTSANLSKSPRSLAQSNGLLGNKWNLNCSPGPNTTFEVEPYLKNGFYKGMAAASFEELNAHIPSVGFDSGKNAFKPTTSIDVKPMRDVNLNVALPYDAMHDLKSDDPSAVFPWLRGKGACSNKAETSNNGPSSYDGNANANKKPDSRECSSSRKILGVPIFEYSPTAKKENFAAMSPCVIDNRSAKEETGISGRKVVFDMNVPFELSDSELDKTGVIEVRAQEKKVQAESTTSIRNHFDLNSCITEEEIPYVTPLQYNSMSRKCDTGIDLEAPIVLEDEEEALLLGEDSLRKEPEKNPVPELPTCRTADDGEVELAKSAAEAIIAISSSPNLIQSEEEVIHAPVPPDVEDPLHLLADIACSSGKDNKELDDFESMTLRLKESTFEEYFPKPSIPDFPNLEDSSTHVLTTRTRKGHARRGRQRRDFQRDILPGLISLSRHEVTEDMQTFGGLMRATGYDTWQFGPNRRNATRNGCGRGRRRGAAATPAPAHTVSAPVHEQQNLQIDRYNREMGLEDRSLTGWGKTTRRPRRQRLPAGNLTPPLPLS